MPRPARRSLYRYLLLAALLAPAAAAQPRPPGAPRDFSGEWILAMRSRSAFGLRIEQQGTGLRGAHCAVTPGGRRVDGCDRDDVAGEVVGNVATVRFRCFAGEGTGRARIVWYRGFVLWRVTADSSCDDTYVPSRATLQRGRAWWLHPAARGAGR